MGFNRIAKALALMAVMTMAFGARAADDRVSMFGYFRVQEGWQVSPTKGAQVYYGLPGVPQKFRLGNENDWAEFGWNLLAYKGEDGTIGHAVIMVGGNYDPTNRGNGDLPFGGWMSTGNNSPVYKQLFVDVQKIPGLADATLWIGKKYYKRYYSPINDFFYWSNDGFGAGIEDINLGGMKLSYAAMDAGHAGAAQAQGIFHDLRLTDIAIIPGGRLDVGVGLSHKISENSALNSGFMGNIRWTQDVMGGSNSLTLQYGMGSCGNSPQFGSAQAGGIDLTASKDAKKARLVDVLSIPVSKEVGIDFAAVLEHNELNGALPQYRNWVEVGARLSYHFSPHASFLLEAGVDSSKATGVDSLMLIKVTPAIEVGTGYGNVPHIRLFATIANANDAAAASVTGDAAKKTAVSFGLQGEAWF